MFGKVSNPKVSSTLLSTIKHIVSAHNKHYKLKIPSVEKNAMGIVSRSQTETGSGSLHRPDRIIESVGATKVYDPPITTGNLVPTTDCNRVFNPATNSRV